MFSDDAVKIHLSYMTETKMIIFEGELKSHILGGVGLKKHKRTKNMLKLGHYLAVKQKIQT